MVEKEHFWREVSITAYPKEEDPETWGLWGLKEDPIIEDPKDNSFNEKPKKDVSQLAKLQWNDVIIT